MTSDRDEPDTNLVRQLNDEMRAKLARTIDLEPYGRLVLTRGVSQRGDEFVASAIKAVADFSQFTEDNDPYGEHDFGSFEIDDEKLFWKIDYYDPTITRHSDDKSNVEITTRVLTVMLTSEY